MSNAKTAQYVEEALEQHAAETARRTGIIIDAAIKNIALLMAKDIAELKYENAELKVRINLLERALAPGAKDNDKGSNGDSPLS